MGPMKRTLLLGRALRFALSITPVSVALSAAAAQQGNVDRLAHRIVTTAVAVRPGEVVVITGGKHTISLMEALAIETQKACGMAAILRSSDKVVRSLNVELPEQFLMKAPRSSSGGSNRADVLQTLPRDPH